MKVGIVPEVRKSATRNPVTFEFDFYNIYPELGSKCSVNFGTDSRVYEIIHINESGKTITLREMKATPVEGTGVFHSGGFAAHCSKQPEWKLESDEEGAIRKATYRKKKKCFFLKGFSPNDNFGRVYLNSSFYKYDYNF